MKDDETAASGGPVVPKEKQNCGIAGFLQILQEMDEAGETRRDIAGDVNGPFFSRAVYECVIRIGMDSDEANTSAHRRSA
jgi:hypothetical protein